MRNSSKEALYTEEWRQELQQTSIRNIQARRQHHLNVERKTVNPEFFFLILNSFIDSSNILHGNKPPPFDMDSLYFFLIEWKSL